MPDIESAFAFGFTFGRISIISKELAPIGDIPGGIEKLIWWGGYLYFIAGSKPDSMSTSLLVHRFDMKTGVGNTQGDNISCQVDLRWTGEQGYLAELVQEGLQTSILRSTGDHRLVIYKGMHDIDTWDLHSNLTETVVLYSK